MTGQVRTDPLVVFLHIPKTAGSTVNAALGSFFAHGHEHIEHIIGDLPKLKRVADEMDWVSGHVPFHVMKGQLKRATTRPLRFFSILREPMSQVRSHYNWLIEIHYKGERFYRGHPEKIKAISERLRKSDNSDPDAIAANLQRFAGLFLNTQSRILLGNEFNWNSGQLLRFLRQYEFIATPDHFDELLTRMCGDPQPTPKSKNVAHYRFDRRIFETTKLRNFMLRNNFLDQILYQSITAPRHRAAISAGMRTVRNPKLHKISTVEMTKH